ncbi:ribonuclease H-like domain-containing protein [Phlebopus sp. FC_14]|nr:ribonuclease H-like domain-containing protein [Phlebopus sp. FC_14]
MSRIREVWAPNLEAEMRHIRDLIDAYPFVAMDTEFPGVVARPIGTFKTSSDYHYQTMRCNVDLLKIIQVGITLADEKGNFPNEVTTWQFNFRFSVGEDMYAPESIELLQKSGFDFQRHEEMGITPSDFAELVITSGLVLVPEAKWISFHSGYDFGYLVKLLTALSLPTSEDVFFDWLHTWFPYCYDIKFMMRSCKSLKGGLQDVADDLGVTRIGTSHQAGSDSLLTASTFFKMRDLYFREGVDDVEYNGKLYGLGQTFTVPNGITDTARGGATTIAEREDRSGVGVGIGVGVGVGVGVGGTGAMGGGVGMGIGMVGMAVGAGMGISMSSSRDLAGSIQGPTTSTTTTTTTATTTSSTAITNGTPSQTPSLSQSTSALHIGIPSLGGGGPPPLGSASSYGPLQQGSAGQQPQQGQQPQSTQGGGMGANGGYLRTAMAMGR